MTCCRHQTDYSTITHLLLSDYSLTTQRLLTYYSTITCWLKTDYSTITHLLLSDYLLTTQRLLTYYSTITCWLKTDYSTIHWLSQRLLLFLEPLCVVTELISGGNLEALLIKSRVDPLEEERSYVNIRCRLTERELIQIAVDVCSGMRHLESRQVGRLTHKYWMSHVHALYYNIYIKWSLRRVLGLF